MCVDLTHNFVTVKTKSHVSETSLNRFVKYSAIKWQRSHQNLNKLNKLNIDIFEDTTVTNKYLLLLSFQLIISMHKHT